MSLSHRLTSKMEGMVQAVGRYPLATLFLLGAVIMNILSINTESEDYMSFMFTCIVGALLGVVAQHLFERFFTKANERLALMGSAVLLALCYYFVIRPDTVFTIENGIKTVVVIFALMMAFIWIPTIKSSTTFNESFLSAFKSFFISILFTIVIAMGITAIIVTTEALLFPIGYRAIPHLFNIIFVLFAPLLFLSFIPFYIGKKDRNKGEEELRLQQEEVNRAVSCPKLLNVLISYIIIPLTAVFTVILLLYIVLNIGGDFWTQNLLEPMLISYSITVILVYILASHLNNSFANAFRRVFPKVLLPIVLLQTIASIVKVQEIGITYGRYYVILFGIFAVITAIIFSFLPIKKNAMIVPVLLLFSTISVVPPVDAFTVSRVNQTNLLKEVLIENGMLEGNTIIPNGDISVEDKQEITRIVQYLRSLDDIEEVEWLPSKLSTYTQFAEVFGFNEVYPNYHEPSDYFYTALDWGKQPVVNIHDYDRMIRLYVNSRSVGNGEDIPFEIDNEQYAIKQQTENEGVTFTVVKSNNEELIEFNSKEIVDTIVERSMGSERLAVEDAIIPFENDQVQLSILTLSVDVYNDEHNIECYIIIQIK